MAEGRGLENENRNRPKPVKVGFLFNRHILGTNDIQALFVRKEGSLPIGCKLYFQQLMLAFQGTVDDQPSLPHRSKPVSHLN